MGILGSTGIAGMVVKTVSGNGKVWPAGDDDELELLSGTYVYGDTQFAKGANQVQLYTDYVEGQSGDCQLVVQFSYNNVKWFDEVGYAPSELEAGALDYSDIVRTIPSGCKAIPVPVFSDYFRVGARSTGDPSGSLLSIYADIGCA